MELQRSVWDREYGRRGTSWSKQTLSLPQSLTGRRVLESGAGNGKTLAAIQNQHPSSVVSYDFSLKALGLCRRRHGDAVLSAADALALPFKNATFDAVVLYYVLNNMLLNERESAVAEARRVLAPGGIVLFEDFGSGDFRQETAGRVLEPEDGTILKTKGLICHYFTAEEVSTLFSPLAAKSIETREYHPFKNSGNLSRRVVSGVFTA
jgi:ubiquinone/menaquinone biosynthesis C-methylase UbiE